MEKEQKQKKIVYVDMDNVLVDFPHGIECLSQEDKIKYEGNYDECPDIFSLMRPLGRNSIAFQGVGKVSLKVSISGLARPDFQIGRRSLNI